jgi:uracil-DNA glycosylase family 4
MVTDSFIELIHSVRSCTLCAEHLPHGVRPVLQINPKAKILIAGQAPGRKVHESGIPFDDASGDRLREWMQVSKEIFYNDEDIAILPMGFCYPGTGKSGDLPPRPECEIAWREKLMQQLPNLELILVIGQYAQSYHLSEKKKTLTETVQCWQEYIEADEVSILPLPHPSPRNNIWLKRNPWFEIDVLPTLKKRIEDIL